MGPRQRIALLILIMTFVSLGVETISFVILYHAAFEEEKMRLVETAKSQARLIEAIARFGSKHSGNYPGGPEQATLSQIVDAHDHYQGFGDTGEFTLGKTVQNKIVFLLSHRHYDYHKPKPVPLESNLAEPMRLALSRRSGVVVGLDYRGQKVLAAYEPVSEFNWGIVAKIDIDELRAPFIKAGIASGVFGIIAVAVGAILFVKITNPLIIRLSATVENLTQALGKVRLLSGLLPICASCKKIRDDSGYWNQIEEYIRDHSEAEFSHGICPDCAKRLYPNLNLSKRDE